MRDGRAAPSSKSVAANNLGLCANCTHARRITTDKGSLFLQCQLSFADQRFAKYPALPVLACSGFQARSRCE
jgi:hypothetical protein